MKIIPIKEVKIINNPSHLKTLQDMTAVCLVIGHHGLQN
jgi:hypothetical protein